MSYIGKDAFLLSLLQTLQLDNPALSYIGETAFRNGTIPNLDLSKIPNVAYIGNEAFVNVTASSLDFSQNMALQYIGNAAFQNATLTNLDLSNSPNLTYLGYRAFQSSTLDEIWISPEANFAAPEYAYNNTGLYTGLYNDNTAVFRTHSGTAALPPDPDGNINKSGTINYVFASKYDYSGGSAHEERSHHQRPWSQQVTVLADQSSREQIQQLTKISQVKVENIINP